MRKLKRKSMLVTALGLIVYILLKLYVLQTPTPDDDHLPDLACKLLASSDLDES